MTTAITEYSPIEAVLADLTTRHQGVVFDVTQPSGMKSAKAAAKDIAQYRIALEKKRVELKEDVLKRGRLLDGEAKRISTQLAALEDPIVAQIKAEERREEEARQAAIRAEQERLEAEARAKKEAEERAMAEQRAEIARQRAALEAEERERRRKLDEEEAASRRRMREEEEKARAVREAADRTARVLREAEETRLKVERVRIEEERRAADEQKRKEREAEEAKAREAQRQQNEIADARTMLATFKKRFGHRPEFVLVLEAIDDCLEIA